MIANIEKHHRENQARDAYIAKTNKETEKGNKKIEKMKKYVISRN